MKIGVHLRNEEGLKAEDKENIDRANVSGALVMWYHTPAQVISLGIEPANCVVRLQDSVYKKWPSGEKYIPSWYDYARDTTTTVRQFYAEGFRLFQLDCEPDLSWPDAGYTPAHEHTVQGDWAWFMGNAVFDIQHGLRYNIPSDAKLGLTPFSCPSPHQWQEAARLWQQEGTYKSLTSLFDFVTAHCYWQAEADMYSLQFGRNYLDVLQATNYEKPLYVTEVGCSSHSPEAHERRIAQYPYYPSMAKNDTYALDKVAGIYYYILGSNPEWTLFNLDSEICDAIGQRPASVSGGGRGRLVE